METSKFESSEQLRSAHALAGAHAHLWAEVPAEAYVAAGGHGIAADEVCRSHERATRSSGAIGGTYPASDHTTTSGRLRWSVRKDGQVEVVVFRPGHSPYGEYVGVPVLEALLSPKGEIVVARTMRHRQEGRTIAAEARHVDAVAGVVTALGGDVTGLITAFDDDELTAHADAEEEARAAGAAVYEETRRRILGSERDAAVAAEDARRRADYRAAYEIQDRGRYAAAYAAAAARAAATEHLYDGVQEALTAAHAARDAEVERVRPLAFKARLRVLRDRREASPAAEERRYQATRAALLERAGVAQ